MICQMCGASLSENSVCQDLYNQLSFYTLAHPDQEYFLHQLIVDSYGAQHISEASKPVAIVFELVGLYLFAEKGYTGKEVQKAHMWLGQRQDQIKPWPAFKKTSSKAKINASDALRVPEGSQRDEVIKAWAEAVWESYSNNRQDVIQFLAKVEFEYLI